MSEPKITAENIICAIVSLSAGFQNIRSGWGKPMAISGAQLSILSAIAVMDRGGGISVKEVAGRMRVDSSFITLCTRPLEKAGLLRRRASAVDARVVLMSLTDTASELVSAVLDSQLAVCRSVFTGFDDRELSRFDRVLHAANFHLDKARRRDERSHPLFRHRI